MSLGPLNELLKVAAIGPQRRRRAVGGAQGGVKTL
jgi:hypothetical protein